jgi:hypothetical protein
MLNVRGMLATLTKTLRPFKLSCAPFVSAKLFGVKRFLLATALRTGYQKTMVSGCRDQNAAMIGRQLDKLKEAELP